MPVTPYLDVWDAAGSVWNTIDIDLAGICDLVLTVSYEGPSTLDFTAMQPQHVTRVGGTAPNGITGNSFIRLRASTYNGGVDPVFEGWTSVTPGDQSIGVKFHAIDPSGYSRFPLMAYGWTNAATAPFNAVPVTGGLPRIGFNCKQDADDDYTWERAHDETVGAIITTLLNDQAAALREELAAVPVGDIFNAADLSGLTFKPQEKFICESEALRSAIMRLLGQYYPAYKLLWQPGTRLWRVFNLLTAPATTLTLNDASGPNVVLSYNLRASLEGRATAVQVFGPPVAEQWDEYHGIATTLNASVVAGATTLPCVSLAQFPTTFPFRVYVENEMVTASGSSGSSLTVGATAGSHVAGVDVTLIAGVLASSTAIGATTLTLTAPLIYPTSVPFYATLGTETIEVTAYTGSVLTVRAMRSAHTVGDIVAITAECTLLNGRLTDISDGPLLDTWGAGVAVYGKNKWQITDTAKRKIFRWLKDVYPAPLIGMKTNTSTSETVITMLSQQAYSPVFMVRFKANNMGNGLWQTVNGYTIDFQNGIISTGNRYLYRYNPAPPLIGGLTGPKVENPEDVKLVFCAPSDPLNVRYPTSGFAGTAYSQFGVERVRRVYDEMLAVGYEIGTAYTTAARLAQYTTLCQELHKQICDTIYAGGVLLSGLQWDFLNLNATINLAGKDADGNSLTTNWESIAAAVTQAEFNFTDQTTTLGINSDKLAVMGEDFDKLKKKLRIRPLKPVYQSSAYITYTPKSAAKPTASGGTTAPDAVRQTFDVESGVKTELLGWFDPETGERG